MSRRNNHISIHAPIQGAIETLKYEKKIQRISIHAPIQGAINKFRTRVSKILISIHAPIQGAIMIYQKLLLMMQNFNPRTYTRCDKRS